MLNTPAGSTEFMIWQTRRTVSGASSADFTTTALPARIAGAIFSAISSSGTFHGMMAPRSEEHTSELQSLMRISYAVFCLTKKKKQTKTTENEIPLNTHNNPHSKKINHTTLIRQQCQHDLR